MEEGVGFPFQSNEKESLEFTFLPNDDENK